MSSILPNSSRILLVEDQPIIAMDVEYMLADHGVATVDTAATTAEALAFIEAARPDAAILDFNLRSGTSLPVAEQLLALNVPFIFTTGYGDGSMIPAAFSHIQMVTKPYDATILIETLTRAMTGSPRSA